MEHAAWEIQGAPSGLPLHLAPGQTTASVLTYEEQMATNLGMQEHDERTTYTQGRFEGFVHTRCGMRTTLRSSVKLELELGFCCRMSKRQDMVSSCDAGSIVRMRSCRCCRRCIRGTCRLDFKS